MCPAGIRLFDGDINSNDVSESKALVHEIESVDIYSNSWGPGDIGVQVEGPGPLTSEAIKYGIEKVCVYNCGDLKKNGDCSGQCT